MADEPSMTITLRDIYDGLRKLQEQVAEMTPQGQQIQDHEARLRGLERWRYALPGSLVLAAVAIITAVLQH